MSGLNTIPPCPSMKPVAPPPSLLLAMAKIFRIRDKDSEDVSRPNNEKKQLRDEDILTVYPSTAIGAKEPSNPVKFISSTWTESGLDPSELFGRSRCSKPRDHLLSSSVKL